ncbi:DUF1592 domain-containing protein [Maioricimonas rarisocia]|uniref:DUF1592 domain-containing protein n=1 Tax=Maioricimonas rarisocia TaxID=2528026 RepID=UPI0018D25760|nr:DUF1592 domain-containing protein [Maioricimonas rarisocia]
MRSPRWAAAGTAVAIVTLAFLFGQSWRPGPVGEHGQLQAAADDAPLDYTTQIRPFFEKYCFDCHSGEFADEGLAFDEYKNVAAILSDRKRWEKVYDLVRVGAMPPADMEQPSDEERQKIVDWLDHTLFFVDCEAGPDPGRVTIRRLNRNEYNNTIRDLVGVDFEPANDFPSDDVGYGFDNIGDVLSLPPLLLEKYLDAAEQVADKAIVTPESIQIQHKVIAADFQTEGAVHDGRRGTKSLVSRGTVSSEVEFPASGDYIVRIVAGADQAGDEPAKMAARVGEENEKVFEIKEHRKPGEYELKVHVSAGKHRVSASFINDYYNPDAEDGRKDRNLFVRSFEIEGPFGLPDDLPESHRRLIVVRPGADVSFEEAARQNLAKLLPRAFRQPVTDQEIDDYAKFVQLAVDQEQSFERGMQIALQAALVSPRFLFRVEHDERPNDPGAVHSVSDFELASRLSYFLWSSMPDDELLELARQGVLHRRDVITKQVDRMMADPRSSALIENFASQWLGLRKLTTDDVSPDPDLFPEFDEQLRRDMWKETEMFFASVVREDRPLIELLDGRYTFVNGRLAELYGIPDVKGDEFQRVSLDGLPRAGLLTQPSILTLTSYPRRTSPVIRGDWVLANLLGDEPPDPPPLVPGLEETQESNPDLPLRKQLEIHRQDPGCASCHKLMDDIGFGLENFDPIGRWREKEGKFEVDSSGVLPTGETFEGPIELITILRNRREEFCRCFTEKLLTFALGRGLEFYDRCAVDTIMGESAQQDYRFSAVLKAIVTSEPFLMRRGEAPPAEDPPASEQTAAE